MLKYTSLEIKFRDYPVTVSVSNEDYEDWAVDSGNDFLDYLLTDEFAEEIQDAVNKTIYSFKEDYGDYLRDCAKDERMEK